MAYPCPHTHFLSDIPVTAALGTQTCPLDLKNAVEVGTVQCSAEKRGERNCAYELHFEPLNGGQKDSRK